MMLFNPFAGKGKNRSWFWWGINIGVFLALLVWWWMRNQPKDAGEFKMKVKSLVLPDDEPALTPPTVKKPKPAERKEPDDLKVIEGIGPRSAQVLGEAGIATYAALAAMKPDAIREVLRAAGVRVPYPETWPKQAALAAGGKWDALKKLQNSLKGGRRA